MAQGQFQLEQNYLAILCVYPALMEDTQDPRWFTWAEHQMLLGAMISCYENGEMNTAKMISDHPVQFEMFMELMDLAFSKAHYENFRGQLQTNFQNRQIVEMSEALDRDEITQDQFFQKLEQLKERKEAATSGLPENMVDFAISPNHCLNFNRFQNLKRYVRIAEQSVTTIAAFTSRGKSALAMNLANDLRQNYPVIYFNLEMNQVGFVRRLLAMNTGIPMGVFSGMQPTPEEYERMKEVERSLKDGNFTVYNGTQSAESIRTIVNRCKKPPVIFVDHVNYLTGNMKLQERERISESMRILNGIAKDGKATVFVLAQINRDGEQKASLSKLQGSSSIEQDSDNVLILEPKEDEYEPSGRAKSDIQMVLKAQKVRDGAKGCIEYLFRRDRQQFVERN